MSFPHAQEACRWGCGHFGAWELFQELVWAVGGASRRERARKGGALTGGGTIKEHMCMQKHTILRNRNDYTCWKFIIEAKTPRLTKQSSQWKFEREERETTTHHTRAQNQELDPPEGLFLLKQQLDTRAWIVSKRALHQIHRPRHASLFLNSWKSSKHRCLKAGRISFFLLLLGASYQKLVAPLF